jgi:hypothetical protein
MALMERIDSGDAVWMMAPDPGRLPVFKGSSEGVKGMYASLELREQAHGYLGMRFDSDGRAEVEARGGEDFLKEKKQNPSFKELLGDSRVYVADRDVIIEARVSETKVAELAKRLAQMNDGEWLLVLSSLEKLMGGN